MADKEMNANELDNVNGGIMPTKVPVFTCKKCCKEISAAVNKINGGYCNDCKPTKMGIGIW